MISFLRFGVRTTVNARPPLVKTLSTTSSSSIQATPRRITAEEIQEHNQGQTTTMGVTQRFWAVIDGWVVDATEFLTTHPGGRRKLLSTNVASEGVTGQDFGFSLSRGKNAHSYETVRRFQNGVQQYLKGRISSGSSSIMHPGNCSENLLPPGTVNLPPHGTLQILGRLSIIK
jgi:hypothetical protein